MASQNETMFLCRLYRLTAIELSGYCRASLGDYRNSTYSYMYVAGLTVVGVRSSQGECSNMFEYGGWRSKRETIPLQAVSRDACKVRLRIRPTAGFAHSVSDRRRETKPDLQQLVQCWLLGFPPPQ